MDVFFLFFFPVTTLRLTTHAIADTNCLGQVNGLALTKGRGAIGDRNVKVFHSFNLTLSKK
jgi:hypothetical protein